MPNPLIWYAVTSDLNEPKAVEALFKTEEDARAYAGGNYWEVKSVEITQFLLKDFPNANR